MITRYKTNLQRRKTRIRAKIKKNSFAVPRLSVFRSCKYIYAQIIQVDKNGKILLQVSSQDLKEKGNKTEKASQVGKKIAQMALKKNIKKVVFDRSGYKFAGRVKALAQSAKEGGLKF